MFYHSMQLPICAMNHVLEWPIFVLPLGLSWMGLFCTMLWLLSCFYLFILQLSSLYHLRELLFIWTYLCGHKVDHNHFLLIFLYILRVGSLIHLPNGSILSKASSKDIFHCFILSFRITLLFKSLALSRVTAEFVLCIY